MANVTKLPSSNKMSCDLLVPKNVNSYKTSEPTHFDIAQIYDLDVVPLKEEDGPHVHFALFVDHKQQQVTYHPITSRVQLSTGRPVPRKKRKTQHLITKIHYSLMLAYIIDMIKMNSFYLRFFFLVFLQ